MMKIDLVYIHDENTLEKIGLIDDFKSFVWNNKYYESGDFEIIVPLNVHNLNLLKRNRFITRPGLKEIAIIETVSAYSQNDTEEIKVTGTMAQSLLSRRVIWDSTLVNGATIPQLRALINNNLINPKDKRRCIPSGSYEISKVGNYIEKEDIYTAQLQSVSANAYVEQWQSGTGRFYSSEQVLHIEKNVSIETEEPTFAIVLGEMLKNPITNVIDSIDKTESGYKKIQRVGYKNDVLSYLKSYADDFNKYSDNKKITYTNKTKGSKLVSNIKVSYFDAETRVWTEKTLNNVTLAYMQVEELTLSETVFNKETTFFNWLNKDGDYFDILENGNFVFKNSVIAKCFTEFNSNDIPYKLLLNKVYVLDRDKTTVLKTINYESSFDNAEEINTYSLLGYYLKYEFTAFGYFVDMIVGYDIDKEFDLIKGYALYDLETPIESSIDLSALPKNASVYKLMNNSELSSGLMSFILSYTSPYKTFLNLGVFPQNKATIYEIVDGENLESYVEENLQSMGLGLKARYEESNNQIYLDFYSGNNLIMENGKLRPVIFSKNMDALNGYNITESNKSKYTVVRLKAKDENDNEIKTEVGAGSGITRIEKFTSLNDLSTYSGADYIKSLASKGELFLNGFERVIDAEIFANAYKYREHYNVGDLCTIIVDDFSLRYDIRILGVCESYDTNGYQISLILGA